MNTLFNKQHFYFRLKFTLIMSHFDFGFISKEEINQIQNIRFRFGLNRGNETGGSTYNIEPTFDKSR